jgi:hypothetical protein
MTARTASTATASSMNGSTSVNSAVRTIFFISVARIEIVQWRVEIGLGVERSVLIEWSRVGHIVASPPWPLGPVVPTLRAGLRAAT